MNTPAHLIFGAAAFAKPGAPWVTLAALAGALAPDLSLYLMAGTHLFILGTDPAVVFNQLYFSDAWMNVFRVDNSFILWGIALGLAVWFRSAWAIAFTGAAMLHLVFDFPFHHDDGRPQFWPLTMWIFESPVSYWDRRHYGGVIGTMEMLACLALLGILWMRFKGWIARALIGAVAVLQIAPVFVWIFVFGGEGPENETRAPKDPHFHSSVLES